MTEPKAHSNIEEQYEKPCLLLEQSPIIPLAQPAGHHPGDHPLAARFAHGYVADDGLGR
jgi:hypothetical protein